MGIDKFKLNLGPAIEFINANKARIESDLESHSPVNKTRPATIHHTIKDIKGNQILDAELYERQSAKFGRSGLNSFNRASHYNRNLYASGGIRNVPKEEIESVIPVESDLFLMHWLGHFDNPVRESRNPREVRPYFHSFYENKGNAIDDFLLYLSSNPNAESKTHVRQALQNRITYLIGKDIDSDENSECNARTEYSLLMMQKRIDRINQILATNKPQRFKTAEKLINYQAQMIQEGILLCTTLTALLELIGDCQKQRNQIKQYAIKLNLIITSNSLKLHIIKSDSDELIYKSKQIMENTRRVGCNISDITLPINYYINAMRTSSVVDVIGDPRNYRNDQFDKMYSFEHADPDEAIELKRILKAIYDKNIKNSDGTRQLADLIEVSFGYLIQ